MSDTKTEPTPRDKTLALCEELNLQIIHKFVPWSKSRNYDPTTRDPSKRSLNWKVTLLRNGRPILENQDYMTGIAHCDAYKKARKPIVLAVAPAIEFETEQGRRAGEKFVDLKPGKPYTVDICDYLYCVVSDGSAIDYPTYEEWAPELGFDPDSRKGEAIYRQCLEIGLKLRAGLGEDNLRRLREALEGF